MDRHEQITKELADRRTDLAQKQGAVAMAKQMAAEAVQNVDRLCVGVGAQMERIATLEAELVALTAKAAEADADEALVEKLDERRKAKQA